MRFRFRLSASALSFQFVGLSLTGLSFVFTGCGSHLDGARDSVEMQHQSLQGSLYAALQEIQASEYLESCDRRFYGQQVELAQALDREQNAISRASEELANSPEFHKVPLGPIYLREPLEVPAPRPGWQERVYGWEVLFKDFAKLKNQPIGEQWVDLERRTRSLLLDDQNRVLRGVNFYLDKDSGEPLFQVRRALFSCVEDLDCRTPHFSPSSLRFIRSNPYLHYYWAKLNDDSVSLDVARDFLVRFIKRVDADLKRYSFTLNETVSHSENVFTLPMELSGVESPDARALLQTYVEQIWSGNDFSVKIQWSTATETDFIFRVLLGDSPNERSYVEWTDRTIHLYSNVLTRTVAHEVGHALGFSDHYYSVWHPEFCMYLYQEDESDLMSNIKSGQVTTAEWRALKQLYP